MTYHHISISNSTGLIVDPPRMEDQDHNPKITTPSSQCHGLNAWLQ